ncbi:MAG: hypothetical protein J6Q18_02940, partial [Oscillospiraceae bacterium]|nr:hypothetical protein [Oscillospiraceae bacterium]
KYGVEEYYVLDTESFEITPLTLIGEDSGFFKTLYRIYSVTPDYFLVATNPSRQHNNRYINDMSVISKTDFYNNNHNLQSAGVMYAW